MDGRSDCNEVITLVFKETLNCVSRHLKQHLSFRLLHVADKDKSQELMFWALAPRKSKLGNCGLCFCHTMESSYYSKQSIEFFSVQEDFPYHRSLYLTLI